MAKFLLRCAEDVDIFHAAAVIAGSVMKIALEMSLIIRAFEQTHASRYNNLCVVSDAACTTSLAWLQSLNVIIDEFTFVLECTNRCRNELSRTHPSSHLRYHSMPTDHL